MKRWKRGNVGGVDLDEFLVALANCVQERIFQQLPRGRAFRVFRD